MKSRILTNNYTYSPKPDDEDEKFLEIIREIQHDVLTVLNAVR